MQPNQDLDAIKFEVDRIKEILAEQQAVEMSQNDGVRNIWIGYVSCKLTEIESRLRTLVKKHYERGPS